MTGFKLPKQTVVLDFAGGDFEGAEVRMSRSISLETYLFYSGMSEAQLSADGDTLRDALHRFGEEILVDWNIVADDDVPVPATGDGMMLVDTRFALEIVRRWQEGVGEVDAPLAEPSPNGKPSEPEASATTGRKSKNRRP